MTNKQPANTDSKATEHKKSRVFIFLVCLTEFDSDDWFSGKCLIFMFLLCLAFLCMRSKFMCRRRHFFFFFIFFVVKLKNRTTRRRIRQNQSLKYIEIVESAFAIHLKLAWYITLFFWEKKKNIMLSGKRNCWLLPPLLCIQQCIVFVIVVIRQKNKPTLLQRKMREKNNNANTQNMCM